MTLKQRIDAFSILGEKLRSPNFINTASLERTQVLNPWFTPENVTLQIQQFGDLLQSENLSRWLAGYTFDDSEKTVGLITAGNIPLVGFHDIICVLISGFKLQVKVSSNDAGLTALVLNTLLEIQPAFREKIEIADQLKDFDLVIATGSNNSSRYFDYYFGKKPHIIRKNRNALAVLTGEESPSEIRELAKDIFTYFGLGCRSVSKLYIPKGYAIEQLFDNLEDYKQLGDHYKYKNNYDYYKSIYLINGNKHYDNGFLLLKEDSSLASPLSVLHFSEYTDLSTLENELTASNEHIQCVVSGLPLNISSPVVGFGKTQQPTLEDYADNVNTLAFLERHNP